MKIRVMSDLHLEFYANPDACGIADDIDCDLVVLAGDIALGTRGIEWAADTFTSTPVIYVMGNHEFYGRDTDDLLPFARETAKASGVHLLENDAVYIDGMRFLGCTLWTGFDCGPWDTGEAKKQARSSINDFRQIRRRGRPLIPPDLIEWYEQSVGWLEQMLDPAEPSVVVTHFVPSLKMVNPRFGTGDLLTPYFHTDLERLMGAAVPVWICGHNHYSATQTIRDGDGAETQVCSNQLGYPGENVDFRTEFVVTL